MPVLELVPRPTPPRASMATAAPSGGRDHTGPNGSTMAERADGSSRVPGSSYDSQPKPPSELDADTVSDVRKHSPTMAMNWGKIPSITFRSRFLSATIRKSI